MPQRANFDVMKPKPMDTQAPEFQCHIASAFDDSTPDPRSAVVLPELIEVACFNGASDPVNPPRHSAGSSAAGQTSTTDEVRLYRQGVEASRDGERVRLSPRGCARAAKTPLRLFGRQDRISPRAPVQTASEHPELPIMDARRLPA